MEILKLEQVFKSYGSKKVLDNVNISVPKGSIFGFVGKNGAGKTTTMKMILGLEEKTNGQILIDGIPVVFGDNQTNHLTGYLPDVPEFYDYMSAKEYLNFCGEITGISKKKLKRKIPRLLSLVGLTIDKRKIKGYSRGMKQRLGIAQALLNDPMVLICDEPTSALDPSGRNEFLELLVQLKGQMTILFSTHILSDVERICDYVGILNQGKVAVSGSISDLKEKYAKNQIKVELSKKEELDIFKKGIDRLNAQSVIHDYSIIPKTKSFILEHNQSYEEIAPTIFQLFEKYQIYPRTINKIDRSLESIFLEVVK